MGSTAKSRTVWSLFLHAIRISGVIVGFVYVIMNMLTGFHVYDAVAFTWLVVVVAVAFRELRRLIRAERLLEEKLRLVESREHQLLDLVGSMDVSLRQELGEWLHGPAQGGLLNVARQTKERMDRLGDQVLRDMSQYPGLAPVRDRTVESIARAAAEITELFDRFNETTLRSKSHQLFPPLLTVNMQIALEQLLDGRGTLHLAMPLRAVGAGERQPSLPAADEDRTFADAISALLEHRIFLAPEMRYAVYRIVEEALTNAEKKRATGIDVHIDVVADGLRVRVIDQGSPLPDAHVPGLGSKVIDTIVHKVGGSWSLSNTDRGVMLEAHLPDISIRAFVVDGRAHYDAPGAP